MVSTHHREPPNSSVSINAFTSTKGSTRSLKTFKYRQKSKWVKKASLLREYSKVKKKEGMEFQGRKKTSECGDNFTFDKDNISISNPPEDVIDKKVDKDFVPSLSKKKKVNPLEKSLEKAKDRRWQLEQEKNRREEAMRERDLKLRERKRTTLLLRQRTPKGQPVMKHVIHNLLSRLERKNYQDSK
jgi:hypothetical protein